MCDRKSFAVALVYRHATELAASSIDGVLDVIKYLTFFACFLAVGIPANPARSKTIVHVGTLIDGTGTAPSAEMSIIIDGERIKEVRKGYVVPVAGDILVDLSSKTVLPGFIDTHVHILKSPHNGDPIRRAVTQSGYDILIEGVNNARQTLMAGFTSIRTLGDSTIAVVALKRAISNGVVPGPRMWVSGEALGPTGGHSDPANGLMPGIAEMPHARDAVIDGPVEARTTVRRLKREGVDVIKIMPSGGVMSIGDDPGLMLMDDEEMKTVIDTAHALGMKVAAHAHGKDAIQHAIVLGVDSIEHGTYGEAETYKLFREHGTYLVPTLLVGERVYAMAKDHPERLNPSTAEKALAVSPVLRSNFRAALAAGVKISFGTDTFGLSAHGENAQEFKILTSLGMTPMEAILTATRNAAGLLGASADVGSLQAGRFADLVAVSGDPLENISVLERVELVMKSGAVVKSDNEVAP